MKNSILFLLMFLLGCTGNWEPANMSKLNIDPENVINFDIRADSIQKKVIQLETNNSCLIGNIQGLFLSNNMIGFRTQNNVQLFSIIDGSHVCSIDHKGKGPYEYTHISYSTYHPGENAIIVVDNNTRKMIYYSLSGQPISEETLDYAIQFIGYSKNQKIICRGKADSRNNQGFVVNVFKENKRQAGYIPFRYKNGETIHEISDPVTILTDRTFFYQSLFNDTLYYYDGNSLYPRFLINYTKGNLPSECKRKKPSEILTYIRANPDTKIALSHKILREQNNKLLLSYVYDKNYQFCILDTLQKQHKSFRNFYVDDFDLSSIAEERLFLYPYFVLLFDPAQIPNMNKQYLERIKEYIPDLFHAFESSHIYDNPIVLLIKFEL